MGLFRGIVFDLECRHCKYKEETFQKDTLHFADGDRVVRLLQRSTCIWLLPSSTAQDQSLSSGRLTFVVGNLQSCTNKKALVTGR